MKTQNEVIEMLERCLSRKDTICYKLFKDEWQTKLDIAKNNFNGLIQWSEEAKDSVNSDSKIRKIFLMPLAKAVRDGVRKWDDEHFKTERNWKK